MRSSLRLALLDVPNVVNRFFKPYPDAPSYQASGFMACVVKGIYPMSTPPTPWMKRSGYRPIADIQIQRRRGSASTRDKRNSRRADSKR
jgi:hypothetical protein